MVSDYYDFLGVPENADYEEIRTAYRRKTMEYHPDKGGSEIEMKALQKAKATLLDKKKRNRYDLKGHDEFVSDFGGVVFTETGIEIVAGHPSHETQTTHTNKTTSTSTDSTDTTKTTGSTTSTSSDDTSTTSGRGVDETYKTYSNAQHDPNSTGQREPWNTENYWKRKAAASYADDKLIDIIGVFASAIRGYILIPPVAILSIITAVLVLVAKDIVLFIAPVPVPQPVVLPATFTAGVLLLGVFLAATATTEDLDSSDARPLFVAFTLLAGTVFVAPMLYIGFVIGVEETPAVVLLLTFAAYVFFTSSYYGAYVFVQFRWRVGRIAYGIGAAAPWVVYFISFGFPGFPVIEALGETVSTGFIPTISAVLTHSVYGVFVYFAASFVVAITELIGTYQEQKDSDDADRINWTE